MILAKHCLIILSCVLIATLLGVIFPSAKGAEPTSGISNQCLIYIGTYTHGKSKGIYACRMDLATGALSGPELAAQTPNPTFLAIDQKHRRLYAVNEIAQYEGKVGGSIEAFSMDADTGKLTSLDRRTTIGSGPCHVTLDRDCHNALVANYGSGSIAVFPVQADGTFGKETTFIQDTGKGINAARQEGPHAHCMVLDTANRFAFACDLGTDKVMVYRYDSSHGTLLPNEPAFARMKDGAGPRHLAFSPGEHHAYVLNELDSTITTFAYDRRRGSLSELQNISMLPDGFKGGNTAAEVEVHPSGKFLFASNRGNDSIAVFAIDRGTGKLTCVQDCPTQGKTPRHFAIDPTGHRLVVANQDSDNLVVFAIDPETGRLTKSGQPLEIPSPVCVAFVR
jgi:6-phosphogluconolactonase